MPEIDIHLRLASLEAEVAALRNFITAEFGHDRLPSARIDHPSIMRPPEGVPGVPVAAEPWPETAAENPNT